MEEIWKPVVGYEGLYEVSNLGRVKSIRFSKHKIMKLQNRHNYLLANLRKDNAEKVFTVSRLILSAFLSTPKDDEECDHIDRNSLNNNLNNLRWVTRSENCFNRNNWGKSKFKGVHIKAWKKKDGTLSENIRAISQFTINGNQ
jgi:hypothetical protein